uniref:Uncharacterized protein n=1 Tax=Solanum tuberosum TaxID=4113 RepID=M1DZ59_SOLTU
MLSKDLAITAFFHQAPSSVGMATTPPVELPRPPDQLEKMHSPNTSKIHQGSSSDSSYNSSKLQREEAIHVAISEREFDWAQKIMSMARSGEIRVQRSGEGDSQSKDLHNIQKSVESTFPFARNREAIYGRFTGKSPQSRFQERGSFEEIRAEKFNGDYSPVFVEHLTAISSNFNDEVNGNDFAGNLTGVPANHENEKRREEECLENNNRNVQQIDVERAPSNLNVEIRVNSAEMHTEHSDRILVGRTMVSPMHNVDEGIALNIDGGIESSHQNQVNAGHHVQEIQKGVQIQGLGNPQEKQTDSTMEQVRTSEKSKQQEGQGVNIENNNQTPKKKVTPGSEGTQNPSNANDESGRKTPNNKSRGKMSKKKKEAIKRKHQAEVGKQVKIKDRQQQTQKIDTGQNSEEAEDEYANIQSEDEFSQDTQSLNEK